MARNDLNALIFQTENPQCQVRECFGVYKQKVDGGNAIFYYDLPNYQFDIEAAMGLLDRTGKYWSLQSMPDAELYTCTIGSHIGQAETAGEAICFCYLEMMGVSIP